MNVNTPNSGPVSPWWRYGMVWLVIGGPLSVVLACVVTAVLVVLHPDPVLHVQAADEQQPAEPARNHLASPR
jgi:hypothetical protein